ncbi:MFS transporter [Levilactobacillus bambusae]|uniref:MFS transporter n=1 Tax=Levilactobacillus bambusae TaxID=2024736 RepID=A0A2V1N339_9LACO|nr:MFS transporter [Levilactobacillus bambusae]PWG00470.1 MFS transporter [Levilactobacillus bambusae]
MTTKKSQGFGIVLPIILLSYFMILLDNSVVFTGTVKIAQELNLTQTELSWVTNAYSLTFGGFLLFGGRAGDIFGRKRLFNIGLIIFGLGSLLVGLAQSDLWIIAARAFQGIGSAILAPTTLALLMDTYSGFQRTKAIAYYGATAGIGASLGLVIGGLFASLLTWRVGFLINVPIAVLMLIGSSQFLHQTPTQMGSLDLIGVLLSVTGMLALVYSLVGRNHQLIIFMMAVILIGLFIIREATAKSPLMPLRLFTDRERLGGYIARFFYLGAMITFWYFTPQILQRLLAFTPLEAGLSFFPLTIFNFIVALRVASLTQKWGNTKLLVIGVSTTLIGLLSLQLFRVWPNYWLGIAIPMVIIGIGQGLSLSPLTVAGVANTPAQDTGAASGVVNMVHQIGGSIGLSLTIALTGTLRPFVVQYDASMLVVAGLMLIALVAVLCLVVPGTKSSH